VVGFLQVATADSAIEATGANKPFLPGPGTYIFSSPPKWG